MASESIAKLLGGNAELRPLAEQLQLIKRLDRRYRTLVPESLAAASRVCAIDGTTVVVCAASGAVASALRHLAPRLLEGLRGVRKAPKSSRDQELTAVRIEVQVSVPAPKRVVVARAPVPKDKLRAVADKLGDSPLKEALREMARDDQSIRKTRSKT
jgi:hypothetical protein